LLREREERLHAPRDESRIRRRSRRPDAVLQVQVEVDRRRAEPAHLSAVASAPDADDDPLLAEDRVELRRLPAELGPHRLRVRDAALARVRRGRCSVRGRRPCREQQNEKCETLHDPDP